jgi:EpsI family protein
MKGSENHNPDSCFTAQGWQILDRQVVAFGNPPKKAISMQVAKGLKRQQVLYWFQVKDDTMVSKWKHRLYMIKQGLLQKRVSGVVVRLTAPITDKISQKEILALQREFASEVVEVLPGYLP